MSSQKEAEKNCISQTPIDILRVPQGDKNILPGTFYNCSLKEIILPEGLESIFDYAFYHNDFTSIILPSTVKRIYEEAFGFCTKLIEVLLPDTLEYLSEKAFGSSKNITKINIPAKIKFFGGFSHFENLRNLIIPDNLEYKFTTNDLIKFLGCQALPIAARKRLKELGYNGDF